VGVPLLSLAREKLAKRGAAGVRTLRVRAGLRAFVDSLSMDWATNRPASLPGSPCGICPGPTPRTTAMDKHVAAYFVTPAQAGTHPGRSTFEALPDGAAGTWIPGLRPG